MSRKAGEKKCTGCKQYAANPRKWKGGVYCDSCLKRTGSAWEGGASAARVPEARFLTGISLRSTGGEK